MRRPKLLILLLAIFGFCAAGGVQAGAGGNRRINVLYIVSDDLSNRLGCYGDPMVKSPNIDALAAQGVRFDRTYCQFPVCNPSRSSFLTGFRVDGTGVRTNLVHVRSRLPDVVTLPQHFQKAGYVTARVGKLFHFGVPGQIGTNGLDDPPSWNEVVNPRGRDKDDEPSIFTLIPGQFGGTLSWMAAEGNDEDQTDGIGAAAMVRLLEKYRSRPFFLALGLYRPHTPFVAPKKYFARYPVKKIVLPHVPANEREGRPAAAYQSANREQDQMSDDLRRQAIQAYSASTTFMDAQVGKVLAALRRLDLDRSTLVVFHSDHGYHLGEHGLWQKSSLFENSARVPLIIRRPGERNAGRAAGATSELVDLYPTLAEICSLPPPAKSDGRSLVALLNNPTGPSLKPAYCQMTRRRGRDPLAYLGRSVRTERYRYTEWDGGREGVELYDYETDPEEKRNRASDPDCASIVAEMQKLLKRGGSAVTPAPDPAAS